MITAGRIFAPGAASCLGAVYGRGWREELIDQVAVRGVYLHAVSARPNCPLGCLSKSANDLLDLLLAHLARLDKIYRVSVFAGRRQGGLSDDVLAGLPTRVGQLKHDLAAVLMHGLNQLFQPR